VIFASDNGPLPTLRASRSGGFRGSKLSCYEAGIRVPLIVRWPGRTPAGRTDDQTVFGGVDFLPTLGAIAGAPLPDGAKLDGQDQSAALRGQAVPRKAPLFWEYGRDEQFFKYPGNAADRSPSVAMRDGRWKLLVNADGSGTELYDLAADPSESTNVATQHPDVADSMARQALAWRRSLP